VVLGRRVAAVGGWCRGCGGIHQDKTRATVVAFTRSHRGGGGGARRGTTQRLQKQSCEYINTQLITLSL